MKAPDKIFRHLTTGNRLLNGQYYEHKPAKIRYNDKIIEYIRKDALLEWAKEKANDYKGTANIRRSFEMMIRKIESL